LFDRADNYLEMVLDQEPENAMAYVGKLMIELRVTQMEHLANCTQSFDDSGNYKKALRFADDELKTTLQEYVNQIHAREIEQEKQRQYEYACYLMSCDTVDACNQAITIFSSMRDWRDSNNQIDVCTLKIQDIEKRTEEQRIKAAQIAEAARLEEERLSEQNRIQMAKRQKRNKIVTIVICVVVVLCLTFVVLLNCYIIPDNKYSDAIDLMNAGEYHKAIEVFSSINGYKDSNAQIQNCQNAINIISYNKAIELMNSGNYSQAMEAFEALNGYKDSETHIQTCRNAINEISYNKAIELMNSGNYSQAIEAFKKLNRYKDATERKMECYLHVGRFIEYVEYYNPTEIIIPEGVTSIESGAFKNCSNLKTIVVPNSVENIGNSAFYGCSKLAHVTIGKGVTSIGEDAFENCHYLTHVTFMNPTGWYKYYETPRDKWKVTVDLSDEEVAANELCEYTFYAWIRE